MWEYVWHTLLGVGGVLFGVAAIVAAITWAAKTLTSHLLTKNLERHKNDLKAATDRELEAFRSAMEIQRLEHEVRFKKLHDQVADTIVKAFDGLNELYNSAADYIGSFEPAGGKSKDEKLKKLKDDFSTLRTVLHKQRLFIPCGLFKAMREFQEKVFKITINFRNKYQREQSGGLSEGDQDYWSKAEDDFSNEVTPLFDRIRSELQKILGFRESPSRP
jgi:hypothetical protein